MAKRGKRTTKQMDMMIPWAERQRFAWGDSIGIVSEEEDVMLSWLRVAMTVVGMGEDQMMD
jgi:hypothetical protein